MRPTESLDRPNVAYRHQAGSYQAQLRYNFLPATNNGTLAAITGSNAITGYRDLTGEPNVKFRAIILLIIAYVSASIPRARRWGTSSRAIQIKFP
jgi:hypothetical protein